MSMVRSATQSRLKGLINHGALIKRLNSTAVDGVPAKPVYYHSFGIPKVLIISAPFIYIGAFSAKSFAAYLEDFDLFVPDDDDD